jgi:hypothetical protein
MNPPGYDPPPHQRDFFDLHWPERAKPGSPGDDIQPGNLFPGIRLTLRPIPAGAAN